MILIKMADEPKILKDNKEKWLMELEEELNKGVAVSKLPKKFSDRYRHKDIKSALVSSSHNKCAYCESSLTQGSYMEVEHFKPKSLYPKLFYTWDNYLPVCKKCNVTKLDHDVVKEEIINPAKEDPEEIIKYCGLQMYPKCEDNLGKVQRTINVLKLNTDILQGERAKIANDLNDLFTLIDCIIGNDYCIHHSNKTNYYRDIIKLVDRHLESSRIYAGFSRWYVSENFPKYAKWKIEIMNFT